MLKPAQLQCLDFIYFQDLRLQKRFWIFRQMIPGELID